MRRTRVIALLAVLATVCALALLAMLFYLASIGQDGDKPELRATAAFVETNNAYISTAIAATQTARAQ
jgi:hypothetical protein